MVTRIDDTTVARESRWARYRLRTRIARLNKTELSREYATR